MDGDSCRLSQTTLELNQSKLSATSPPPAINPKTMKKTALFLFAGILTIWSVHAQGTLEFTCTLTGGNVVPSSGSPFLGDGRFWLEGTTLNFALGVYSMSPEPTGAQLRGPTDASTSAPVLFDLGPGFSVNPDGFNHWQTWAWGGAVTGLSSQDIADLSGVAGMRTSRLRRSPRGNCGDRFSPCRSRPFRCFWPLASAHCLGLGARCRVVVNGSPTNLKSKRRFPCNAISF